ncbi:MAG: hypothetical protein Q9157_005179 [Trypethelium eluteriae]
MADVSQPSFQTPSRARDIPLHALRVAPPTSVPMPSSIQSLKHGHMNLGTFSPVSQDGCFDFDRVIKSGQVLKRTRKTKSWGPIHLVLRPHHLSIYKDANESRLRHQLRLSDVTAIARQRDPRGKAAHVFGVFSPSRNFHFSASSDREAQEWVELIRREARIDEEEEEMFLTSPGDREREDEGLLERKREDLLGRNGEGGAVRLGEEMLGDAAAAAGGGGYSSSEAEVSAPRGLHVPKRGRDAKSASAQAVHQQQQQGKRTSHVEYSGPEMGSYSDFSDAGIVGMQNSALSLPSGDHTGTKGPQQPIPAIYAGSAPVMRRNASQMSGVGGSTDDAERVVCQGWLHLLKSTRGMRQWKKAWVVLRPKNIAFYKNEEEYSATLILPFSSIIDAVDLDPISRRHPFCMQIIAEDRNYRFCAQDEDSLARWLGALKSLLAKRKEAAMVKSGASPK